jgi:hypothetical protein
VSGQLHDEAALAPMKEHSILIEDEVSLTPGLFGEEKNLLAVPVIKARLLFHPDHGKMKLV